VNKTAAELQMTHNSQNADCFMLNHIQLL